MFRLYDNKTAIVHMILVALSLTLLAQFLHAQVDPAGVAAAPSGDLFLLEVNGKVSLLTSQADQQHPRELFRTSTMYNPVDIAASTDGSEVYLFVVQWHSILSQPTWIIDEYSSNGNRVATWKRTSEDVYSGVTVDSQRQIVYLAKAWSGEIHWMSVHQSAHNNPTYLMSVFATTSLGALAVDEQKQQLFVADPLKGQLYVADLARKTARLLCSGVGEPAALAYDRTRQKLYVADRARGRIWQIAPDAAASKPTVFSPANILHNPTGVATDKQGFVWVGDAGAHAVYVFSPSGQLTRTIR